MLQAFNKYLGEALGWYLEAALRFHFSKDAHTCFLKLCVNLV